MLKLSKLLSLLVCLLLVSNSATSNNSETIFTFEVDDVEHGKDVYFYSPSPKEALTRQIGEDRQFLAYSHENDKDIHLIYDAKMNGFIRALHSAYINHYSIKLSVSDFILLIGQGLAKHMEANAEDLRRHFVDFEGKEKIIIMVPDEDIDWLQVVSLFGTEIQKRIKTDLYQIIIDDTSVATPITRIASEITIMDSFQHYFNYEMLVGCGFPKITLVGKPEDWEKLRTKVKKLQELNSDDKLNLDWWLKHLVPVIDRLVDQAASRKVDRLFWKDFYKGQAWQDYSITDSLTGWVQVFFPYIYEGIDKHALVPNSFDGKIKLELLPDGSSVAPFIMEGHPKFPGRQDMFFYGGFLGAELIQDEIIAPVQFYAVGYEPKEEVGSNDEGSFDELRNSSPRNIEL